MAMKGMKVGATAIAKMKSMKRARLVRKAGMKAMKGKRREPKVTIADGPPITKPEHYLRWNPRPLSLKRNDFQKQLAERGIKPESVKDKFSQYVMANELSQLMVETKRQAAADESAKQAMEEIKKKKGQKKGARECLALRLCHPDDWKTCMVSTCRSLKIGLEDIQTEERLSRGELEVRLGPVEAQRKISQGKWRREEDSDGDSEYVKVTKQRRISKDQSFQATVGRSKYVDNASLEIRRNTRLLHRVIPIGLQHRCTMCVLQP